MSFINLIGSRSTIKIIVALAALLALAIWFSIKRTDGFAQPAQFDKSLQVEVITVNSKSAQSITVSGRTTIASSVRLLLGALPYYGWQHTSPDGSFTFNDVIIPLGSTNLKVEAKSSLGWRSFAADKEKNVWVTESNVRAEAPDDQHEIITVESSKLPQVIDRKVVADVSYRNLIVTLDATLQQDDQRVQIIYGGDISLPIENRVPQFIREVFKDLRIAQHTLSEFTWESKIVPCNNKRCTFHAVSKPYNIVFSNELDQKDWTIHPVSDKRAKEGDNFELRVNDYQVQDPTPQPQSNTTNIYIWDNQQSGDRKFKLNYRISGFSSLFRILKSSPYELVPNKFESFLNALLNVLIVVPIIWIYWFLIKRPTALRSSSLSPESQSLLICLVSIPFFSPVHYLVQTTASYLTISQRTQSTWPQLTLLRLFDPSIFSTTNDLRLLIISACIIGLFLGLVTLAVRFVIQLDRLRIWLTALLSGVLLAVVMNVVLMVFLSVTLKILSPNSSGLTQLLATSFNAAVLLLLAVLIGRTDTPFVSQWSMSGRTFAVIVLVLIVSSYPGTPFNLFDTRLSPIPHLVVRKEVETFFYILQTLSPYVALVFLTPLMKVKEQRIRPRGILTVGLILFAGFLVGTTPKWLILPLPFLIALWMFRRYVMKPIERQMAFDKITSHVLINRPELLAKAQLTLDELRDLKTKRKEKMLTRAEYNHERRKLEASDEITEIKIESRGVSVTAAVLGIGPFADNWTNGIWAIKPGLIVAAPIAVFHLWEQIFIIRDSHSAYYVLLSLTTQLSLDLAYWALAAFFFGYFFKYLTGESGLRKALRLAVVICICLAASNLIMRPENYVGVSAQFIYFFVGLGLVFDYKNFRDASHAEFTWSDFCDYENLSGLRPFYSMVGTVLSVLFSGAFAKVFTLFAIQVLAPNFPNISRFFGYSQ
jgi:hypothetical protein